MFQNPRRVLRWAINLSALILLPASLFAQAPKGDLLDQVKRQSELAAQKLEAEVRDALAEAQKSTVSDPVTVLERLKRVLGLLDADRALTTARRDLLTRQIKDKIKTAEAVAQKIDRKTNETNQKLAEREIRAKEAEQRAAEAERINRTLDYVAGLQKEGKTNEATRVAEDLFRRHPNLATPQAIGRTSSVLDQVTTLRNMRNEADGRRLAALTSIDRAALSPGSDVEFPKDWATKVKQRTSLNQAHLSTKDKEILKSLGTPIPAVDYNNSGFLDVIEDLSTKLGQPILLDKAALADVGVSSETQVSLKAKGLSGRTALRKVLGDVGLAYIIKDEAIQVVSEKVARETMITRTYYLGNLLAGGPFSDAGIRFVPGLNQFEAMQNVLSIVNLLQSTVDPGSWAANGGMGTITFHAPTMALIIRNTAEVHGMMGGYR
jgi:hypothetical protein